MTRANKEAQRNDCLWQGWTIIDRETGALVERLGFVGVHEVWDDEKYVRSMVGKAGRVVHVELREVISESRESRVARRHRKSQHKQLKAPKLLGTVYRPRDEMVEEGAPYEGYPKDARALRKLREEQKRLRVDEVSRNVKKVLEIKGTNDG